MTNKLVTITQSCLGAYILQALNTETCLNCLWWQAWWFVTKKLRATWTLSWNIQTKAIGNFEKHIYFNHLATIYTGLIWFQVTTKEACSKMTPPFFLSHRCDSCSWQSTAGMAAIIWKTFHWEEGWRVYSATPAAGHGWAGTHQQGWGSF